MPKLEGAPLRRDLSRHGQTKLKYAKDETATMTVPYCFPRAQSNVCNISNVYVIPCSFAADQQLALQHCCMRLLSVPCSLAEDQQHAL